MLPHETNTISKIEYLSSTETLLTIVSVRKDGIIEIRFKLDTYEVEVSDQLELLDVFVKLTDDGRIPYHIMLIPGQYGSITKEAREIELFDTSAFKNQKSMAIVVYSTAQRLLASFFFSLKKHKPQYPYKLFTSEDAAYNWTLDQMKK